MTNKLLLEFAFVIFILQVFRLKSYLESSKEKQIKYKTYENSKINAEGILGVKLVNRLTVIVTGLFGLIYISFYLVGFKLFIGTNLVVFPILLTTLILYEYILIILDTIKNKSMNNNKMYGLIDKISQPANTAYLIYFVWYVLKYDSVI